MLARVAFSARPRPHVLPSIRLGVSNFHLISRSYTRDRRDSSDYKIPDSAKVRPWQNPKSTSYKPRSAIKPPTAPADQRQNISSSGEKTDKELDESSSSDPSQPTSESYHVSQGDEAVNELDSRSQDSDHYETEPEHSPQPPPADQEPETQFTPQKPLPDLRYGIPSTLDAELKEAHSRQETSTGTLNITEDPAEPPLGTGGRDGDGLPRSSYISSSDRKRNTLFKFVYLLMGLGSVGYVVYLGRNWTDEEEEKKYPNAPSGWGIGLFYNRVMARLGSNLDYYNDPVFTKLLPDEDKDPARRFPFVLVLSLDDMLIHSEWTREAGWRIAKRPGLDYFLRYLCQYYEIVMFTSQPSSMAGQVYQKLDPFRVISWPLYREATLYKDGVYIKDLSYLNRPLNKVLMIDTDPNHVKHQPENAIIIPKWTGDPKDQTLVQFIPFLEYLATMGFDDARTVLKSFEGTYIPAEFARREKLLRQKFAEKEAEKKGKRPMRTLGSLFAAKQPSSDGSGTSDGTSTEGKMLWDQIRERGQKEYEALNKRIEVEGAKWLAEEAAMVKKMEEEAVKEISSKGLWGYFGGAGNSAAELEKGKEK